MIDILPIETNQSAPILPEVSGSATVGAFGELEEEELAVGGEAFDSSAEGGEGGEGGMGALFFTGDGAKADTGVGAGAWSSASGPNTGTHEMSKRSYPALHEAQMAASLDVHAVPVAATPFEQVHVGGAGAGAGAGGI